MWLFAAKYELREDNQSLSIFENSQYRKWSVLAGVLSICIALIIIFFWQSSTGAIELAVGLVSLSIGFFFSATKNFRSTALLILDKGNNSLKLADGTQLPRESIIYLTVTQEKNSVGAVEDFLDVVSIDKTRYRVLQLDKFFLNEDSESTNIAYYISEKTGLQLFRDDQVLT